MEIQGEKMSKKERVTSRELYFETQGGFEVYVPIGSIVETDKLSSHGACFVSPNVFPLDSIEKHDATYYGFRVSYVDTMER